MISAVVLAKNEKENIKECLESLKWCDEIIVIDDESEDKTCEIAKKSGAKVFTRTLNLDYAAQRNYGLQKAQGDWVLFVDADERVDEDLMGEIKEAVEDPNFSGYFVKRTDFMFGRWLNHGETSDIRLLRLARKGTGEWVRPVHEVWKIAGTIGNLENPLLHYPHPSVTEFLGKINLYTTLDAQEFYKQGAPKTHRVGTASIIFYPVGKFLRNYFLKLGFLDGTAGFMMAMMMSFHSFLTRGKLWLLVKNRPQ